MLWQVIGFKQGHIRHDIMQLLALGFQLFVKDISSHGNETQKSVQKNYEQNGN